MSDSLKSLLDHYAKNIPRGIGRAAHYRYLAPSRNEYPETVVKFKKSNGVTLGESLKVINPTSNDGHLILRDPDDGENIYYTIHDGLVTPFVGAVAHRSEYVVTQGEEHVPDPTTGRTDDESFSLVGSCSDTDTPLFTEEMNATEKEIREK